VRAPLSQPRSWRCPLRVGPETPATASRAACVGRAGLDLGRAAEAYAGPALALSVRR